MIYTTVCSFDLFKIFRLMDSLRKSGYQDKIHLTITHSHNDNVDSIQRAMDKLSTLFDLTFDLAKVDPALWRYGTEKTFLLHQWKYINELAEKVNKENPDEWIVRTDAFDVLFQDSPEKIRYKDNEIYVGFEGVLFENSPTNQGWIPDDFKDLFEGKEVICSGVVVAQAKHLKEISSIMLNNSKTLADQPEFNLALYEYRNKSNVKIVNSDLIINMHEKQLDCEWDKGIIKYKEITPCIIHANGGEWPDGVNKKEFPLNLPPKNVLELIYPQKNAANKCNIALVDNEIEPIITAYISTKNRNHQTLELSICSLINSTIKPKELLIIDDNEKTYDYNNDALYSHLRNHAQAKGIFTNFLQGNKKNQVFNHDMVRKTCTSDYILRIDDDVILDPDALEHMVNVLNNDKKIGAVAPRVLFSHAIHASPDYASNRLDEIFFAQNKGWFKSSQEENYETKDIEHLYGACVLYRRTAGVRNQYELDTKKGFREETIFTNKMFQQGWKLALSNNASATHYQMPKNAPGSPQNEEQEKKDWEYDENKFEAYMASQGVKKKEIYPVHGMHGIGDQIILARLMPEICEKNKDKKIILCCSRPEIFEEFIAKYDIIVIRNMHQFASICNSNGYDINKLSVYHEGASKHHISPHAHIEDAYRSIYGLENKEKN